VLTAASLGLIRNRAASAALVRRACIPLHPQGGGGANGNRGCAPSRDVACKQPVNVDFKIANAFETLSRFGLVRREAEQLIVLPLEPAIAQLHQVWNNFSKRE
jgi:hypothetical protein